MADDSLVLRVLDLLWGLPPAFLYATVGAGAAIENFFPPVPADTFVLLGAFLAAEGRATPIGVFVATWLGNVSSALIVYALARSWGPGFFQTRAGRWLLRPGQLERISRLYHDHGSKITFGSRFLPGFRAIVPVFAGISRLGFLRTAIPLVLASAIWYGVLVYLGVVFGRNWRTLVETLEDVNTVLLIAALGLALAFGILWWRTRHRAGPTFDRRDRPGGQNG